MRESPLVSILTLGCKLNLADSDSLSAMLATAGYRVTHHLCEADAVVINTCSVTKIADQKSRKLIRAARRLSPSAQIAVTGCYPATVEEDRLRDLGVHIVAGTAPADRERVVSSLQSALAHDPSGGAQPSIAAANPLRSRAFVEAQSGCNDTCAFCIIPRTRGPERSRTANAVCGDINAAVAAGTREVVVTGTQLGAWGRQLPGTPGPAQLIGEILKRTEVPRLRFSSLQPEAIRPELLALWQDPRLMPHFHLALQSGSDSILEPMRRRYSAHEFELAVERIRAAVPEAAITTDVIAGFPGESDRDFEQTLRLCERLAFARIHGFPFSARERTLAARLPGQLPTIVKRQRMARLLELSKALADKYEAKFLGTIRPVLWEAGEGENPNEGGTYTGYTDNYVRVRAAGQDLGGRITPARLLEPGDGLITAELTTP